MLDLPDLLKPCFRSAEHQADVFRREAVAEIVPDNDLASHHLVPVSTCSGRDDEVLQVDDGTFATVHLTWTGRQEPTPWPTCRRFETTRALLAAGCDHEH
jgi:hypothetical protein